jgi:hypothetical protein
MKYILAASFAMAALVSAAPVNNKRDLYYSTTTEEVWETVWSTTTIWVDPTEIAVARPTSVGGFYEVTSNSARFRAPTSSASSSTSSYNAPVAAVISSTSTAPASTSTSVYVAPAPTSTSVAPYVAPVVPTTTVAPVAPTSTPVYVAPAPVSTAPAPVLASTSSSTTGTHTGDMTYYDVSVGLTSCGLTGSNSDLLVAMNAPDMANGVNPNNNPHCNKMINIYYNGVGPIQGKVVDTCPECVSGSIDVTDSLFKAIAPNGDGRVKGVSWSWA